MYYEFYIDQFVAEQFLVGYLLLKACTRLQRKEVSWKRIAAGSTGNAVLAAAFVCMGIPQGAVLGMLAAGMIVFVGESIRRLVQDLLMLLFVTACFAGTLELILGLVPLPVAAGSIAAAVLMRKGWQMSAPKKLDGHLLTVRLYWEERTVMAKAIRDTGNQLSEPLTGRPVSIVDAETAKSLLGEGWEQKRGFYLIPYHSLGTEKSWMRGVTIDRLEVLPEGERMVQEHPVLALYEGKVSSTGRYEVILHPDHMKQVE